ncbi:hypothetical protein J7E87_19945 [Streptomyces sp. ISL-1]|uniref:hypothetical protein n=1 Tax=Streptomyces sp. ISL-1 TaxID=2817657 RepID=UPI001BE732CE|nr:hypothetical protein [Streptomyces sp. ISL-1]MBT2391643.1 hypothetical protein [Streptomyces sp. ISL-1]
MTTTSPADARTALAAAKQEKTEAQQLGGALAERVRSGDPEVTPKQLAEAKQLAEFADLRITAAQRKLAEAEEADRRARAEEVAAVARDIAGDDDPRELAACVRAVVDATAALVAVAQARDSRIRTAGRTLRRIDLELSALDASTNRAMRDRYGVEGSALAITVHEPYARVESVRPAAIVAAAVGLGAGTDHYAELREAFGVIEFMVPRVLTQMPPLDAALNDADASA